MLLWPRHGRMLRGVVAVARRDRARRPVLGVIAYADLDRLLSRMDETRQLGLAHRVAIWRDRSASSATFPSPEPGQGLSPTRCGSIRPTTEPTSGTRHTTTTCRSLPKAGCCFVVPAAVGARRAVPRPDGVRCSEAGDPLHWMRLGAVGVPGRRGGPVDLGNRAHPSRERHARGAWRPRSWSTVPPRTRMLRLGIDVDGVVADFRSAFRAIAERELGIAPDDVEAELSKPDVERLWRSRGRRHELVARRPAVRAGSDRAALYARSAARGGKCSS